MQANGDGLFNVIDVGDEVIVTEETKGPVARESTLASLLNAKLFTVHLDRRWSNKSLRPLLRLKVTSTYQRSFLPDLLQIVALNG